MNHKHEASLFVSPDVVVTRTLIKIANVSYAVAHVNSVFIAKRTAHKAWVGLILFSALMWYKAQPFYASFINGSAISFEHNQDALSASMFFFDSCIGMCCLYFVPHAGPYSTDVERKGADFGKQAEKCSLPVKARY